MQQLKTVYNEMLPVYETSTGDKVVNARELHESLMVGKDFTTWIKSRIDKYGFVENEDFSVTFTKSGERQNVTKHEYLLTLDTAKEIAMVQNNEMGRAIRKYFIEVEKHFRNLSVPSYMIEDSIQRAQQWINEQKEKQQLQLKTAQQSQIINELQPKATYYDLILQTKTLVSVTQIAKDYGMSGQFLNNLLKELGVQYKQSNCWLLYQKYADKGYTQSKTHAIDAEKSKMHTYWTQKGRLFIYDLLKNERSLLPTMERQAS